MSSLLLYTPRASPLISSQRISSFHISSPQGPSAAAGSALTCLNLSRNNLGHDGAKEAANGLKVCMSLTAVDLAFNDFGAEGIKALASMLLFNR
jgi:hypothetical protein